MVTMIGLKPRSVIIPLTTPTTTPTARPASRDSQVA